MLYIIIIIIIQVFCIFDVLSMHENLTATLY